MKKLLIIVLVVLALIFLIGRASATTEKVKICHGTGSSSNPWVEIVVSDKATGGHFNENGTPRAGHESDVLVDEGDACPAATPPTTPPKEEPKATETAPAAVVKQQIEEVQGGLK